MPTRYSDHVLSVGSSYREHLVSAFVEQPRPGTAQVQERPDGEQLDAPIGPVPEQAPNS
jgi:hypothetical protein